MPTAFSQADHFLDALLRYTLAQLLGLCAMPIASNQVDHLLNMLLRDAHERFFDQIFGLYFSVHFELPRPLVHLTLPTLRPEDVVNGLGGSHI